MNTNADTITLRAALDAIGHERNTWARQMADLRDERDAARDEAAQARLDLGRVTTERDVLDAARDQARAVRAALDAGGEG